MTAKKGEKTQGIIYDVCIVGAGASGVMAAIAAAGRGKTVLLVEQNTAILKKLLVTGNGRCNIGHVRPQGHYIGHDVALLDDIYHEMDDAEYKAVLAELGILLTCDGSGRLYPVNYAARGVADLLTLCLKRLNVQVLTSAKLVDLSFCRDKVLLKVLSSTSKAMTFDTAYSPNLATARGTAYSPNLATTANTACWPSGTTADKAFLSSADASSAAAFLQSKAENQKTCSFCARHVIFAGGSGAYPQVGADFSLWRLAETFGIKVYEPNPVLTPLLLGKKYKKRLSLVAGTRVRATAQLFSAKGTLQGASQGEFLFADYGISGIAAMELAQYIPAMPENQNILQLDLLPEFSIEYLTQRIYQWLVRFEAKNISADGKFAAFGLAENKATKDSSLTDFSCRDFTFLSGILPPKLIRFLLPELRKCCEKAANEDKQKYSQILAEHIAKLLKSLRLDVAGTRGFAYAQASSGGIALSEINIPGFSWKRDRRLKFCGEILDYTGETGGYNLRFAFTSGYLAGKNC